MTAKRSEFREIARPEVSFDDALRDDTRSLRRVGAQHEFQSRAQRDALPMFDPGATSTDVQVAS